MEISDNINPKNKKKINIYNNLNKLIKNLEINAENNTSLNFNHHEQTKLSYKYCYELELSDLYIYLEEIIDNNIIPQIIPIIKIIQKVVKNKIEEYKEKKKENYIPDKQIKNKNLININHWEEKFNKIFNDFKKKNQLFYQEREKQFDKNLEKRKQIIKQLKKLYTTPYETNNQIFKKFREIKSDWHHAGIVSKNVVDSLFKTYFHHLNNFYSYLNLNKELQNMDYAHNLKQRKIIINRAQELLNKSNLFESLNELQYLHKLWKEEAEPVEEKYKESTWIEFKMITNKIHERKNNWIIENQKQELQNLQLKEEIINQLNNLISKQETYLSHNKLQETIKKIEILRKNFVKIGKIPKNHSDIIWIKFKEILKKFANKKNEFYKNKKNEQNKNLIKKNELIHIANNHKNSQNWLDSLKIFKKIQNEWKLIGHIPKKLSDKKWNEFKSACDYFFYRYKNQNQENYQQFHKKLSLKHIILEKLHNIKLNTEKEKISTIKHIKELTQEWNKIEHISNDNSNINLSFYRICNEIFHDLNINQNEINQLHIELELEHMIFNKDNKKINEAIKKIKKQIQELKNNISILENNLSFFGNTDKNNPLIKNVYKKLENKQQYLQEIIKNFNILCRISLLK